LHSFTVVLILFFSPFPSTKKSGMLITNAGFLDESAWEYSSSVCYINLYNWISVIQTQYIILVVTGTNKVCNKRILMVHKLISDGFYFLNSHRFIRNWVKLEMQGTQMIIYLKSSWQGIVMESFLW